jgi:FemAB-related protein (PEP-CTERM system-associated)
LSVEKSTGLEIRPAVDADAPRWDEYVRGHSLGTVFHLWGWGSATKSAFGAIRQDLLALDGGEIVGVLPLSACRRFYKPRTWISAPWGVYGDPLGDQPLITRALAESAVERARSEGVPRLELRCREDHGLEGFISSDLYATYSKALPATPEEVMSGYKKSERRYIRQAEEVHGLRFEEGDQHRPALEKLFLSSKRALGSPGLSHAWWSALEEHLKGEYTIHAAVREETVLAATLTFHGKGEASLFYVGTTPEANRDYSATKFMIAKCSEWATREGYLSLDLGRSRQGTGAAAFKVHQGFEATPLSYQYALLNDRASVPSFNPSNPRTELARKVWSKMPLMACELLTAQLGRFLA